MKKCSSCTKDLPDAALHCVFCGAKQPPAPAVQQGMAKTAYGYSASDMLDQIRQQGAPQARTAPPPAPAYNPPPPAPAYNPPPYNPPRPAPMQPLPPPVGPPTPPPPRTPPAMAPHPGAGAGSGAGPPGNYVPPSPASAPTMFVQGPPQPPQPQMLGHHAAGPTYGRPNLGGQMPPTLIPPSQQPPTLIPPPQMPQQVPQAPQMPQVPMMRIPVSQPPPYLASQAGAHASRPIEPWRDSLRLVMFVWGVALLVAFATPLQTSPALHFNWNLILDGQGTARLPPLMLAVVGLLGIVVSAIPMPSPARGLLAAILGLAGIGVPIALVGVPPWQALSSMIGALVLVPGLLMRAEYRDAALPRILVTIGAIGILLPFVVPHGGAIPLVNVFKDLIDQPGLAKIPSALQLGMVVIVVMSLLAWLPAPVTGGAALWAWLVILWALIVHVAAIAVSGNLADAIKLSPNAALLPWIAGGGVGLGSAYLALVGYGVASAIGKQLE